MSPLQPSTAGPKSSNRGEAQEKVLKTYYVKVIEIFKESQENTIEGNQ